MKKKEQVVVYIFILRKKKIIVFDRRVFHRVFDRHEIKRHDSETEFIRNDRCVVVLIPVISSTVRRAHACTLDTSADF